MVTKVAPSKTLTFGKEKIYTGNYLGKATAFYWVSMMEVAGASWIWPNPN